MCSQPPLCEQRVRGYRQHHQEEALSQRFIREDMLWTRGKQSATLSAGPIANAGKISDGPVCFLKNSYWDGGFFKQ